MARNKVLRWFGKDEKDKEEEDFNYQKGTNGRPLKIQWQKPHETTHRESWNNALGKSFESAIKQNKDRFEYKKYHSLPPVPRKPRAVDPRRFGMVDPFNVMNGHRSYTMGNSNGWNPVVNFVQELQQEGGKDQKGLRDSSKPVERVQPDDLVDHPIDDDRASIQSHRESQSIQRRESIQRRDSSSIFHRENDVETHDDSKPPVPKKSPRRVQERKGHGTCPTCKGMVIEGGYYTQWCQHCESRTFEDQFEKWSSGSDDVDCFILESQVNAKSRFDYLEWIPFDRFKDVQLVGVGGFGRTYHAIWLDGPREKWDKKAGHYVRCGEWRVVLKGFDNSEHVTLDFFDELEAHLRSENNSGNYIVRYYGITQCPKTKNYMIVVQYARNGDLRRYLKKNLVGLSWQRRLDILYGIATGLIRIHRKDLVHRNLHGGNILLNSNMTLISDLGLCRRADNCHATDGVFGVLPYVAPEVLMAKPYTKAADVYSFGTIMWELAFGRKPFGDRAHDSRLAIEIGRGLRPEIVEEIPECYSSLMESCWDSDPLARPTADRLYATLGEWLCKVSNVPDSDVAIQFLEAEQLRLGSMGKGTEPSATPDQIESPIESPIGSPTTLEFNIIDKNLHPEAIYRSRFLKFLKIESIQVPTIIFTRTDNPREHLAVTKYIAAETRSYNVKYEMIQAENSEVAAEVYDVLQYL